MNRSASLLSSCSRQTSPFPKNVVAPVFPVGYHHSNQIPPTTTGFPPALGAIPSKGGIHHVHLLGQAAALLRRSHPPGLPPDRRVRRRLDTGRDAAAPRP